MLLTSPPPLVERYPRKAVLFLELKAAAPHRWTVSVAKDMHLASTPPHTSTSTCVRFCLNSLTHSVWYGVPKGPKQKIVLKHIFVKYMSNKCEVYMKHIWTLFDIYFSKMALLERSDGVPEG